jgi:hypothetical protein
MKISDQADRIENITRPEVPSAIANTSVCHVPREILDTLTDMRDEAIGLLEDVCKAIHRGRSRTQKTRNLVRSGARGVRVNRYDTSKVYKLLYKCKAASEELRKIDV